MDIYGLALYHIPDGRAYYIKVKQLVDFETALPLKQGIVFIWAEGPEPGSCYELELTEALPIDKARAILDDLFAQMQNGFEYLRVRDVG